MEKPPYRWRRFHDVFTVFVVSGRGDEGPGVRGIPSILVLSWKHPETPILKEEKHASSQVTHTTCRKGRYIHMHFLCHGNTAAWKNFAHYPSTINILVTWNGRSSALVPTFRACSRPDHPTEKQRIETAGGTVSFEAVSTVRMMKPLSSVGASTRKPTRRRKEG